MSTEIIGSTRDVDTMTQNNHQGLIKITEISGQIITMLNKILSDFTMISDDISEIHSIGTQNINHIRELDEKIKEIG